MIWLVALVVLIFLAVVVAGSRNQTQWNEDDNG